MKAVNSKALQKMSAKLQYLAALVVAGGWSSPNMLVLMSDETPLPSGKITMDEASWIASFLYIGSLSGNFFFGFITNRFGRKQPLLVIAIPAIASWLLVMFAENVYYLYAARLLSGFVGGGTFIIIPLYLSEIASDCVRGVLGSTFVLSGNIGILLAFIIGNFCDFYTTPKFVIALMCVFVFSLLFFPESPSFLMKQNRVIETEKSIRFYQNMRSGDSDYEFLQAEMKKLENTIRSSSMDEHSNENSLKWSDFKPKQVRKALLIGIGLTALNQFCGCYPMLNYTAQLFKEAGSSMDPNTSAIVIGVIQLVGSYVALNLVDRAGRKFLYVTSTIGTALGFVILGVYIMLKSWNYDVEMFSWVPIASFSFIIFIASWAVLSLPYLVVSEIMPEKLKDFGTSLCVCIMWSCAFIATKYLPTMNETIGMHGSMFVFSGVCLTSAAFIIACMPETKGKSYEEIMRSLQ